MVILSSDERFADPPLSATAYSWRQDDSWKTDKHLCLEKVKENGLYLATAAEEMRSNRRIVLAAVKSDGHALNVASEALKNDEEIVFAAIEQDGDSLSFAGDTLRTAKTCSRSRGRPFLTKEEMDQAARETEKYCEKFETWEWKQGVKKALEEAPSGPTRSTTLGQAQAPGQGRRHLMSTEDGLEEETNGFGATTSQRIAAGASTRAGAQRIAAASDAQRSMPPRPAREARQPGFTPGKEAWRINIERQLSRFCESSELSLAFPPTLSSRSGAVPARALKLGLATKSQGKGDERFLTVKKPQHVVALDGDAPVASLAGSAARRAHAPTRRSRRSATPRRGHVADAQAPRRRREDPPAMLAARMKLPAWEYRDRVAALVAAHDVVLVAGETGCGKSTQVPQFVLDGDPEARIACSQPRRISAMAVAERVASERGSQLGREVGFHVRFESSFSDATRLCFATPGVLLRKLGSDPDLVAYTHFILDEVHEEDRDTEFCWWRCGSWWRGARTTTRSRLRLVLMSATLAADKLTEYFGGCPRISIGGSNFPVSTFFLEDVLKQTKYVTLPKEAPRADAFDGLDADAKAKVVAAGKALDLGLRCALCGKSTSQSPEELGDHMAECLGEMEEPASPGGGDDDAAVLADVIYHREDEFELGVGSLHLCPVSRDDDDPRNAPAAFAASQASSADGEGDALVRVYQRRVAEQTLDELLVCALLNYVVRSSHGAAVFFVAGWADIESIATAIEADDDLKHVLWVVPLHGSIESSKQKGVQGAAADRFSTKARNDADQPQLLCFAALWRATPSSARV
ncbi:helicase [Aureococcus anophagefferens]|nr:helicase [Aureococcus anophagefferens]